MVSARSVQKSGISRPVLVVSGLPRSGTSLMMQMLEAAGIDVASDHVREADDDNRRGYYELEAVKRIREDTSFFDGCVGKAVKVVAPLLPFLPTPFDYYILFMDRDLDEVLASQQLMLRRRTGRGEGAEGANDSVMARAYQNQLEKVDHWIDDQSNLKSLRISHRQMLAEPAGIAQKVAEFLSTSEFSLQSADSDVNSALLIARMANVVDPELSRQSRGRA